MAKKYYAVAVGRESGIFTSWATAEQQVKGFPGAKYKGFPSKEEAETWLENPVYQKKGTQSTQRAGKKRLQKSTAPAVPLPENAIIVYTDGGCIDNPGSGGYGIVIEKDGELREMSGGEHQTTNNRMEMLAAIIALRELEGESRPIALFSDSSYLVNGINKGWAEKWRSNGWQKSDGNPAKNSDLWEELLRLLDSLSVQFHWVKGHAGNAMNERCDELANGMARKMGSL